MVRIFIVIMFLSSYSYAEMFYWTDENGLKHFSNTLPEDGAENIKAIQEVISNDNEVINHEKINSDRKKRITKQKKTDRKNKKFKQGDLKIVMYSIPNCKYCRLAKAFFNKHGIRFTDYNVESSKEASKKFEALNGTGYPLILVGNRRITGFTESTLKNVLGM